MCGALQLGCDAEQVGASLPPSAAAGAAAPAAPTHCTEPVTQRLAPRSIPEVTELLNALPKPVTLPCFLEQLERPLRMQATRSVVSAQPADGERSPRVFLFLSPLIMSVVPDGMGRALLEFGEARSETTSLKGELEFPISEQLGPEAPFERLMFNEKQTSCSFCHGGEELDPQTASAHAFVSETLRPRPIDRVYVTRLLVEQAACDPAVEAERCAMLDALGADRAVLEHEFPEAVRTFF